MHLPLAMDFRGFVLVDLFRSGIITTLLVSFYMIFCTLVACFSTWCLFYYECWIFSLTMDGKFVARSCLLWPCHSVLFLLFGPTCHGLLFPSLLGFNVILQETSYFMSQSSSIAFVSRQSREF